MATGSGTPAQQPALPVTVSQSDFGLAVETAALPGLFEYMGQEIVYTPDGESPVTIRALVAIDPEFSEFNDDGTAAAQEAQVTIWMNEESGIVAPARGDGVLFQGREWYVIQALRNPNLGIARLSIRHEHIEERTRADYRRGR